MGRDITTIAQADRSRKYILHLPTTRLKKTIRRRKYLGKDAIQHCVIDSARRTLDDLYGAIG